MNTYRYTIPGPPITKKNHQEIAFNRATGRRFVKQSARYEAYEDAASYFLQPKPPDPIDYPVICRYTYYMPARRRVDGSNLIAATDDILVKFLVLADDCRDIVAGHDGTRVLYDKEHPRVEIEITPLKEPYEQWKKRERKEKP